MRRWQWRTAELADMICERVGRNLTWNEWTRFVGIDRPYECTCPKLPIHPSVDQAGVKAAKDGKFR